MRVLLPLSLCCLSIAFALQPAAINTPEAIVAVATADVNPTMVGEDSFARKIAAVALAVVEPGKSLPLVGQCFVVLVCSYVLLGVILYAFAQYKYYKGKFFPEAVAVDVDGVPVPPAEHDKSVFEKVFNEGTLANARSALVFTPVIATLIIYILFRASIEHYDTSSDSYQHFQAGVVIAMIGILLQILDTFSIRVNSEVLGNLSEAIGSLCVYIGLVIFLWALFALETDGVPVSLPTKLITALCVLLMGSMILLKVLEIKKRVIDPRVTVPSIIPTLIDEARLEEIKSTASMAPFMMIVLLYVNFRFTEVGTTPTYVVTGLTGAVIAIYIQAAVVFLKPLLPDTVAHMLKALTILSTNIFFITGMIALVKEDYPGPSIAITHVQILLFVIAALMVIIVVLQEFGQHLLASSDPTSANESLAKLTTMSNAMMSTASFGQIVSIILLFVHFNASILQGKGNVDQYIQDRDGFETFIYFASVSICVQTFFQLLESMTGPNPALAALTSVAILILNIGVVGIIYFVVDP